MRETTREKSIFFYLLWYDFLILAPILEKKRLFKIDKNVVELEVPFSGSILVLMGFLHI